MKITHESLLQSFALRNDGLIVSIDEVQRGLACACTCPGCRSPLIARQGEVRAWHFAHSHGVDCPWAAESALHLAAKEIIRRRRGMALPSFTVSDRVVLEDGRSGEGCETLPEAWMDFDQVTLEEQTGEMRGDVMARMGDYALIVEIAVTHFVDETKLEKIKALGLPVIEIQIDPQLRETWTWDALEEMVIESTSDKTWLFNPEHAALKAAAQEKARAQALAKPAPAVVTMQPTSPRNQKNSFYIKSMIVNVTEWPWGITVWSPYNPEVNTIIKGIVRQLDGQWVPKYKNWLFPLNAKDRLLAALAAAD